MRISRFCLGLLSCFSVAAFAIPCPSPTDFNNHFRLPPMAYDSAKHQIKQVTVSVDNTSQWVLIMHPIKSSPEQTDNNQLNDIMAQLQLVSANSYKMSLMPGDDSFDYCIYTNPRSPKMNILAYHIGNQDNEPLTDGVLESKKVKNLLKSLQLK